MMTPEERQNFEEMIDEIPPTLEEIVKEAKELPSEKIERIFHIKAAVRRMINTF